MKKSIAILALLTLAALAGQVAVNLDPIEGSAGDWLVYDDGTPAWYSWDGVYRGVWFNYGDFVPGGGQSLPLGNSQLWFYHGTTQIWDTSDVYIEVWNGDSMGPVTQLDQTLVTAEHFTAVLTEYNPQIIVDGNFWILANTELSAGGYPSILGDGTPGEHSFFSDDFIMWEPWGNNGDYLIQAYMYWNLNGTSWGSIKTVF